MYSHLRMALQSSNKQFVVLQKSNKADLYSGLIPVSPHSHGVFR